MPSMDVFETEPFSLFTLTHLVNKEPFAPGRLGQMGIFTESGVTTTKVAIERRTGTLALVPVSERGAPATQNRREARDILDVRIPRLALGDTIYADEVQNVRAFGSESAAKTLQAEVAERNARMARNLDATLEHHRMGALKGQILDADGVTVLYDLNTLFDETAHATLDFVLGTAGTDVRGKCSTAIRTLATELGAAVNNGTMFHALVGSTFFDKLVAHDQVRETFVYQQGASLRERVPYQQVFYGGILFEEYRGATSEGSGVGAWIAADEGYVFPVGIPGLFITRFAPADYEETVNTVGLPRYARTAQDPSGFNRYRMLEVQTNPINLLTRPRAVLKIETSN